MTDDLAAYLASRTRPARDWPAPTEPDYERSRDHGDDDWSRNRDYSYPIGWPL